MIVQLKIDNDIISTTFEIPEVYKITNAEIYIELRLRKSIHQTLNDDNLKAINTSPKHLIQAVNHGYTLFVNPILIEQISL